MTILMPILIVLRKLLLALIGEKLIAKAIFGLLQELTKRTTNQLDDELLAVWKEQYYGRAE